MRIFEKPTVDEYAEFFDDAYAALRIRDFELRDAVLGASAIVIAEALNTALEMITVNDAEKEV